MPSGLSVISVLNAEGPVEAARRLHVGRSPLIASRNGDDVSVLAYVLLTVAVFALLGTVLKLIEGL